MNLILANEEPTELYNEVIEDVEDVPIYVNKDKKFTQLMHCVVSNNVEAVKKIVTVKSQQNIKQLKEQTVPSGMSALMFAAKYDLPEIVKLLLDEEKLMKNSQGMTALMIAAKYNSIKVLKNTNLIMVENGRIDKNGLSAMYIAGALDNEEVISLLRPWEGNISDITDQWTEKFYTCILQKPEEYDIEYDFAKQGKIKWKDLLLVFRMDQKYEEKLFILSKPIERKQQKQLEEQQDPSFDYDCIEDVEEEGEEETSQITKEKMNNNKEEIGVEITTIGIDKQEKKEDKFIENNNEENKLKTNAYLNDDFFHPNIINTNLSEYSVDSSSKIDEDLKQFEDETQSGISLCVRKNIEDSNCLSIDLLIKPEFIKTKIKKGENNISHEITEETNDSNNNEKENKLKKNDSINDTNLEIESEKSESLSSSLAPTQELGMKLLVNQNNYLLFDKCIKEIEDNLMTPLMIASIYGYINKITNAVIKKYSRFQCKKNGYTALMLAAKYGHYDIVKKLANIESDIKGFDGETALMLAAKYGHTNIVSLLAKYSSCIMQQTYNEGLTALMLASKYGYVFSAKILAKKEAGLLASDGTTSLMLAARFGQTDVVKYVTPILKKEAGLQTDQGMTALMMAARYNHLDVVTQLFIEGEVMKQNKNGETALMFAASNGYRDIVKVLICHECGMTNNNGLNARTLAYKNGFVDLQYMLWRVEDIICHEELALYCQ